MIKNIMELKREAQMHGCHCDQNPECQQAGYPLTGRCVSEMIPLPTGIEVAENATCGDSPNNKRCKCVIYKKQCVQTPDCLGWNVKCFPKYADLKNYLPKFTTPETGNLCEDGCICLSFVGLIYGQLLHMLSSGSKF